ncbi:hypothetical protein F511_22611 [Dorcoceras hygrometricum]|uniref:Uncharacterized protein n=1 Tax=Dorcoceras hygrometricum TaxID=472368 RepID=A0A2Z7CZL1_9LAMI|nr:hypothetical protein F511_22611 [Dorcoceras hygrometricum]
MAPFNPHTRAAAAIRMKQIALDNQSQMIRRLRAKLATERRESAATNEELGKKVARLERSSHLKDQRYDSRTTTNHRGPIEEKASIIQTIQDLQEDNGAPFDEWEEEAEENSEGEGLGEIPIEVVDATQRRVKSGQLRRGRTTTRRCVLEPAAGTVNQLLICIQSQDDVPVASYSGSSRRLPRVATSRQRIQSQAIVYPVAGYSVLHIQSQENQTQEKPAADQSWSLKENQQQRKFRSDATSAAMQIKQRRNFSSDANSAATQTSSSPRNFIIQISRNPDFCSRTSTVAYRSLHSGSTASSNQKRNQALPPCFSGFEQ